MKSTNCAGHVDQLETGPGEETIFLSYDTHTTTHTTGQRASFSSYSSSWPATVGKLRGNLWEELAGLKTTGEIIFLAWFFCQRLNFKHQTVKHENQGRHPNIFIKIYPKNILDVKRKQICNFLIYWILFDSNFACDGRMLYRSAFVNTRINLDENAIRVIMMF